MSDAWVKFQDFGTIEYIGILGLIRILRQTGTPSHFGTLVHFGHIRALRHRRTCKDIRTIYI